MGDVRASVAQQIADGYLRSFKGLVDTIDLGALERVVGCLRAARDASRCVYVAGNGGSAATASHWVNDLGKATKRNGCKPMRVICLSDNVSWLTALANDEGYERVFAGQLENFVGPGDVFVAISVSGNSPNLVHAVECANANGAVSIALLGFGGGALKDLVHEYVWLQTEDGAYGPVESAHSVVCDILTSCLLADRPDDVARRIDEAAVTVGIEDRPL